MLAEIFAGASSKVREAGGTLAGGHTIRDPEPKYGLAVVGAAHPDRLRGTLGLLYLFLFGALGFTFYFRWDQYFTTYYWNSVLALGLTIVMTAGALGRFTPWSTSHASLGRTR